MSRGSFRQADIERLLRAARNEHAVVQLDLKTLIATIIPMADDYSAPQVSTMYAPDGKENWDDDELDRELEEFERRNAALPLPKQSRQAKAAARKKLQAPEDRALDRLLATASKQQDEKAERRKEARRKT
ncbi:hypothetical protein [Rhizobium sp. BE258]|uniref:hypothetical protein n=1 Tax=Rhizobium sp. BE258 TaxID=2817722 RepID=UPI002858578B|nr:hypothetical protein [Rhizobium sp. BE258]MDR7146175.1 hypothetical protein [Rhizobium sp. BE258]